MLQALHFAIPRNARLRRIYLTGRFNTREGK